MKSDFSSNLEIFCLLVFDRFLYLKITETEREDGEVVLAQQPEAETLHLACTGIQYQHQFMSQLIHFLFGPLPLAWENGRGQSKALECCTHVKNPEEASGFWLLTSDSPNSIHCSYFGSEPGNGESFSLYHSNNKKIIL